MSEILVSLAFFDPDISVMVKKGMIQALIEKEGSKQPLKRITVVAEIKEFANKTVADYVTKSSIRFFELLGISTGFLAVAPEKWETREDYKVGREVVKLGKVVNDYAERGIALIQEFNSLLTKDEKQKQYLLQVVEEQRSKFPDARKPRMEALENNETADSDN